MIILDTMVVSALMQPHPDAVVRDWIDSQVPSSLWMTSISVFEIRYGIAILPDGRRKNALTSAFNRVLRMRFSDFLLDFDPAAADESATFSAMRRATGHQVNNGDSMIAGIALANGSAIATRNIKDFDGAGLTLVDPWASDKK